MRSFRLIAIVAAIACLACPDSPTDLTLEGPAFLRARIDGRSFSVEEGDVLDWGWTGIPGESMNLRGYPAPSATTNEWINIQLGAYDGPGTYVLDGNLNVNPPENSAGYGVTANGVTTRRFETGGQYTGSLQIIAADTITIVGTFTFSGGATLGPAGEAHITQGSFRLLRRR